MRIENFDGKVVDICIGFNINYHLNYKPKSTELDIYNEVMDTMQIRYNMIRRDIRFLSFILDGKQFNLAIITRPHRNDANIIIHDMHHTVDMTEISETMIDHYGVYLERNHCDSSAGIPIGEECELWKTICSYYERQEFLKHHADMMQEELQGYVIHTTNEKNLSVNHNCGEFPAYITSYSNTRFTYYECAYCGLENHPLIQRCQYCENFQ